MTERNPTHYLRDFLQELTDIADFTRAGRAAFDADIKTQKAVIRSYEVIGEIVKRLSPEFRAAHPQVDWQKLMRFRDFIAHNYDKVMTRFLWSAVEDLPALRVTVEELLTALENADPDAPT
jgi:uncharacterized protein with HEPN domain